MPRPMIHFFAAFQFLTVTPPIVRRMFTPEELGRAVGFYPLVGGLLGIVLIGMDKGLAHIFPAQIVSALLLSAWVILTGALHLDGFLDSCDGLLGCWTPEKRLDIMRDERVGAFGLAGGVLLLLLKYAALTALPVQEGLFSDRAVALVLTPLLGRWGMSLVVVGYPYARPEGLGKAVKNHAGRTELALATITALAFALLAANGPGVAAVVLAGLTSWGVARFALARLPGLTGDLYGATCELVELAILLFFVAKL